MALPACTLCAGTIDQRRSHKRRRAGCIFLLSALSFLHPRSTTTFLLIVSTQRRATRARKWPLAASKMGSFVIVAIVFWGSISLKVQVDPSSPRAPSPDPSSSPFPPTPPFHSASLPQISSRLLLFCLSFCFFSLALSRAFHMAPPLPPFTHSFSFSLFLSSFAAAAHETHECDHAFHSLSGQRDSSTPLPHLS